MLLKIFALHLRKITGTFVLVVADTMFFFFPGTFTLASEMVVQLSTVNWQFAKLKL